MDNLVIKKIDKLEKMIEQIVTNMVTKEDAKQFVTRDDFKISATKDDLKNFATKDDLKNFATKDDLKNFATKDDLRETKNEIITQLTVRIDQLDERIHDVFASADKHKVDRNEFDPWKKRVEKLERKVNIN